MTKYVLFLICATLPFFVACSNDSNATNDDTANNTGENTNDNGNTDNNPNAGESENNGNTGDNNNNQNTGDGNNQNTGDGNNDNVEDACKSVHCDEGKCDEGVCVTDAMRTIAEETPCDPEEFTEFCVGEKTYYCDRGAFIVLPGQCDHECVVYDETFHGRQHRRSGCTDGGSCTELNAIKTECYDDTASSYVFVSACQRTTRGTLEWISVDGYACKGRCKADHTSCALEENECDPYTYPSKCDRRTLLTCFLDSNLTGNIRSEYCDTACTTYNGTALCGLETCTQPGARKDYCGYFDSLDEYDVIDTICAEDDQGKLYQVRTGQHTYCPSGCTQGTCHE